MILLIVFSCKLFINIEKFIISKTIIKKTDKFNFKTITYNLKLNYYYIVD